MRQAADSMAQGWVDKPCTSRQHARGHPATVASRGPCSRPDTKPQWRHQTAHLVTGLQGQQAMPAACCCMVQHSVGLTLTILPALMAASFIVGASPKAACRQLQAQHSASTGCPLHELPSSTVC